ncbi:MAG: hypothetical protein ABSF83_03620 [Nitrososphaerales archaeon]|jgi:uncharacterized membrane protein
MFRSSNLTDTVRTILLVVVVFFISVIIDVTIFGVAVTVAFFCAFWYYYRKSKVLQRQMADARIPSAARSDTPTSGSLPGNVPPPPSTDA